MKTLIRTFATSTAVLLALAAPGAAQEQEDSLSRLIDRTIQRMDRGGLGEVWAAAHDLEKLAWGERETAATRIVAAAREGSLPVKLGCARTLLDIQEEGVAVPLLIQLADQRENKEIRLSALSILGSTDYLEERLTRQVENFLNDTLDKETDPRVRIESAKALYGATESKYRSKARAALIEMYGSDIRAVKIDAALALAEIGELDRVQELLQSIQDDPSPQGRMAKLLLSLKEQERYLIETFRKNSLGVAQGGRTKGAGYDLDLLMEIIRDIQEKHIRGDQVTGKEGMEKLLTAAAKGMLNYMDPHSTYFSQKEHERWMMDLDRHYAGIGAYVDTIDGIFTIIRPIYSGPAYRAGLRSGDQIWKVDGWETFNKPNEEIIRRLKGLPGTQVTVTIYRSGWKEERNFTITRREISIPSTNAELLPGGLAYVEVTQFALGTGRELAWRLKSLKDRGAEALIMDLRNNTGGYLNEAINVCSLFLPAKKLVVYTEGRRSKRNDYYTVPVPFRWKDPLVILVNRRSASASEIVSGTLQYYKRAFIMGEKTYGKGSVQTPMPLETRLPEPFVDENHNQRYDEGEQFQDLNHNGRYDMGPMLKITTAMYYLPSGRSIHTLRDEDGGVINEGGVTPDEAVQYEGIEPWKEEELADLLEKKVFKKYVDERYEKNKELFIRLAEGDDFDPGKYPDFDAFYASLNTHLSKNDIRRMIRMELRTRVPDDRKPPRPFPGFGLFGDYQEDTQLQAAILHVLKELGRDGRDILAYRFFANRKFKKPRTSMVSAKELKEQESREEEKTPEGKKDAGGKEPEKEKAGSGGKKK